MNLDNEATMDRVSRIAQFIYVATALFNVLFFAVWGDISRLTIAVLFGVLVFGQRAIDAWRHAAGNWRVAAELWRELAEEKRL